MRAGRAVHECTKFEGVGEQCKLASDNAQNLKELESIVYNAN